MTGPLQRAAALIEREGRGSPDAVRLARVASLAVRVEPHLLRTLRLELLPDVDVGTEADLWFGPLVQSRGATAIVLHPYVVELLRADLAREPAMLQRAARITEQAHRGAPATLRAEEQVNALALGGGDDLDRQIEAALRPALQVLYAGGEPAQAVAHWAAGALPRLHPRVRQSSAALALLLGASARLGRRKVLREAPAVRGPLESVAWALPEEALADRTRVGVELLDTAVRFVAPPEEGDAIELPRTRPLIVGVSWTAADGEAELLVEPEPGRTVNLETDVPVVHIRTLAGDEYRLERQAAGSGTARETAGRAPAPPENALDHALVVGISEYESYPPLPAAEADAQAFHQWLLAAEGGAVPPQQVTLLLSSQTDLTRVNAAVKRIRDGAQIEAARGNPLRRLYLFLAGPTARLSGKEAPALLTNDGAVSAADYAEWFNREGLFREVVTVVVSHLDIADPPVILTTPWEAGAATEAAPSARVLEIAGYEPQATRVNPDGVFTRILLNGLNGAAADAEGRVTAATLSDFLLDQTWQRAPVIRNAGEMEDKLLLAQVDPARLPTRPRRVSVHFARIFEGAEAVVLDGNFNEVARAPLPPGAWQLELEPGLYQVRVPSAGLHVVLDVPLSGDEASPLEWTIPWVPRELRVLVAGTGRTQLPNTDAWAATEVGRALARAGFRLVGCGWPGVDYAVAQEFTELLRLEPEVSLRDRFTQVVAQDQRLELLDGEVIEVESGRPSFSEPVRRADATVLISGGRGTAGIGEEALAMDQPVFALAGAGRGMRKSAPNPERFFQFDRAIRSPEDARVVAEMLVNRLMALEGALPSSPVEDHGGGHHEARADAAEPNDAVPDAAEPNDADARDAAPSGEIPLEWVAAGTRWYRIHRAADSPLWFGSGQARGGPRSPFDDPEEVFGVCYLATSVAASIAEVFLPGRTGLRFEVALDGYVLSTIEVHTELRLVPLYGPALFRLGLGVDDLREPGRSQAWARRFWSHPTAPDGLIYRSQYDDSELLVALFDRASDALTVLESRPLQADPEHLHLLRQYGILPSPESERGR